tara:strand:+ start:1180 stop:2874 length:1695 start_codon:yes stop_codon:yes gene_type:complete
MKLKSLFKNYNIDGYIIPKNDEYFNEFVTPSTDRLKFISNFSGSAGFSIILKNKNYLFVDGRYTIQAKIQSGKKFQIITIPQRFPKNVIKTKREIVIGFDPRLHSEKQLSFLLNFKKIKLKSINKNLVDITWKNRPKEKIKPFFSLARKNAGESINQKITKVRNIMLKYNVDYLFVTAPENIAWILNIRGHDSFFSPLPNCRLLISNKGGLSLFSKREKFKNIKKFFDKKVNFYEEDTVENNLKNIWNKKVWVDSLTCSIFFKNLLKNNNILEFEDPIYKLKSTKNLTEINNIKRCHIIDGIALTKFLFWLKKNFKNKKITEISAQKKLEKFRTLNKTYKFSSFNTISGAGPNSAIIHYRASKESNKILKRGDLYLVDSGGQYHFGTTDVTRTISLENNSSLIKEIYTRVLKGHIAVSRYRLKKNSTGSEIDKKARKFLKQINLDYPHGTGHGVGYFLNVHEGPQSFSKNNKVKLKSGMIISNEPGYYKEGHFGIRIENLIYINKNKFNELTMVPLEKDLINKKMLNKKEIKWINTYHNKVQGKLIKFMNLKEKVDLIKACSPV